MSAGVSLDSVEHHIEVPGGRVWAKVTNPGSPGTPLIALHGGPGFPSYYLEPLNALAAQRPVVLYDQLGCGRSDRPDDPSLWRIERFALELDSVLAALGYSRYHVYGHSWGTMLATHFVTRHGSARVRSIIMSSPGLQIDWWERDCNALIDTLSESARSAIRAANASGDFSGADYEAATAEFYGRYVCKHGMSTPEFQETIAGAGLAVYHKIQGPNEFTVAGDMKGWDFTDDLPRLAVPVLYLTGAEDEARPDTVARFATLTPDSRMVVIRDAAHLTTLDNPKASNAAIAAFLDEVDAQPPSERGVRGETRRSAAYGIR